MLTMTYFMLTMTYKALLAGVSICNADIAQGQK